MEIEMELALILRELAHIKILLVALVTIFVIVLISGVVIYAVHTTHELHKLFNGVDHTAKQDA